MRALYTGVVATLLVVVAYLAYQSAHPAFTPSSDTGFVTSTSSTTMSNSPLALASPAFAEGASIPKKYTCDGAQVSPPLTISGVPEGTASLALIVDDPDVPTQILASGVYDHWILFNIPPRTTDIPEGMSVGTIGQNGSGANAYAAPCPPPQYQPSEHRYVFTLYALDGTLPLKVGSTKVNVLDAMQGHVLAQTQLVGKYERKQ